jgi:hypothetical protein
LLTADRRPPTADPDKVGTSLRSAASRKTVPSTSPAVHSMALTITVICFIFMDIIKPNLSAMKKLSLFVIALLFTQLSFAQWEDDFRLTDTPDTSYVFYGMTHTLAVKGDTVHVVWYEKIDDNWDIFYVRSTDGGNNWDWETRLTSTEGSSRIPSVSVSGSSVYVVWQESIDGNLEICFKRSPDGGETWGDNVRLTNDISYSYEAVIATSGSFVHLAWVSVDLENNYHVLYKNSSDGGLTWSSERWLSPNSIMAFNPSIAADGSGVCVAWNDNRDGNYEIYFSKSSDNGSSWGPETRLTDDPNLQLFPSVAVSGQEVHLVWEDERFGYAEIVHKMSSDGGVTWGEDLRITNDPAPSWNPNLAVSGSVLYLVWQEGRSGFWDIYYNYSTDGGITWATDTQLNDFSYMSYRPHIAADGSVLHVIWYDYRDFNYEIYYKRNPTGGMVGVDEQLRAKGVGLSVYPNPASRQLTVGGLSRGACDEGSAVGGQQSAVGGRRSAVGISIVDLYGRAIIEIGDPISFPYQIDISNLPDGVYILKVTDDSGNESAVKFVKKRE